MKTLTLKKIAFIPLAILIVWGFSFLTVNAQISQQTRVKNTCYSNTSSAPLYISASVDSASFTEANFYVYNSLDCTSTNVVVNRYLAGSDRNTLTAIVPPNYSYKYEVLGSGGTVHVWSEYILPSGSSATSSSISTTGIENQIDSINTTLVIFFMFALTFIGYQSIIAIRKS